MSLTVNHISKTYRNGRVKAVDDFNAVLSSGVYGLLGANGAGKSTLMNIITGNLRPDAGTIQWNGHDVCPSQPGFLSILGYMPQQQSLYGEFSARRFLWYMAALKGLNRKQAAQRVPKLLAMVNLEEAADRKLKTFSGGMKQRVLIAQALLNDPELLILDEPTAGLDPKERIRVRNMIARLGQNRIVLIATHVVSDVESIAKEILIMKKGQLLRRGTVPELLHEMRGRVWLTDFDSHTADSDASATLQMGDDGLPKLRLVRNIQPELPGCKSVAPTLEDLYLSFFADEEARLF